MTMRQQQDCLTFTTPGQGFSDITASVDDWLSGTGLTCGLLTAFVQHTSASLTIQENADPDVLRDLSAFLGRLAPEEPRLYRHVMEGLDDMPAHIRSMVTSVSLSIPFQNGRLSLGTWQGLYLIEHRRVPHRRRVVLHAFGT
jgi:secondary thiamine-phosphate synthase enzyme